MDMSFKKTRIAIVALGLCGLAGTCLAAKMDAIVGDWKLDAAKSTFKPSPGMQKFESKVTAAGDGTYTYAAEWVEGDGTPGHLTYTTALDGKAFPESFTKGQQLAQLRHDLLGVPLIRPADTETTSRGAAYLAGLATGYWKNIDEIKNSWKISLSFEKEDKVNVEEMKKAWKTWCRNSSPASARPRLSSRCSVFWGKS